VAMEWFGCRIWASRPRSGVRLIVPLLWIMRVQPAGLLCVKPLLSEGWLVDSNLSSPLLWTCRRGVSRVVGARSRMSGR
jgi:hypothetical protein